MNSRTNKIAYWVATALVSLFLLPGIFFITDPFAIEGSRSLGIPYWLHLEIGIGKFIGAWLLILPFVPRWLKTWAYVALGIDFISAFIGHVAVNGFTGTALLPLLMLAILLVSYVFFLQLGSKKRVEPAPRYKNALA